MVISVIRQISKRAVLGGYNSAMRLADFFFETPLEFGNAVLVRWVDIHNDEGGWKPVKDIAVKPAEIKTIGWWIGEIDNHYVLCADIANDLETNTRMLLPTGCVLSIKKILCD